MFASGHNPAITPRLIYWEQNINAASFIDVLMPIALNPGDSVFYVIQTALNKSVATSVTISDQGGNTGKTLLFYDGPPSPTAAFHGCVLLNYPTGQTQYATVSFRLSGGNFWGVPTWLSAYVVPGGSRVSLYYQYPNGASLTSGTAFSINWWRGMTDTGTTKPIAQRVSSAGDFYMLVSAANNMGASTPSGWIATQSNVFSAGASLSAMVFTRSLPLIDETSTTGAQRTISITPTATVTADAGAVRIIG